MDKNFEKNNQVTISGEIASSFQYSYEVYGEAFYTVDVAVKRLSDYADVIPVVVSERLVDVNTDLTGNRVSIKGQFRSYNRHEGQKSRLVLSVFAREFELLDGESDKKDVDEIFMDGYLCKEPVYRETPLGREIAGFLVAVNRPYKKTDYIPCICWGRNARFASRLEVGSHLRIQGRIQSREYVKKLSETESETRTAYEVSISKVEVLDE